jgi:uncharacterized protein YidB (DUF937 family)
MGLEDVLTRALGGRAATETSAGPLVQGILDLLADPQTDGVAGLSRSFQRQGLEAQIASWIGTGSNLPISAEQLASALGAGRVGQLAERSGVSKSQIGGVLASVLPALIDQLTPDGQVPAPALLGARGKTLIEGLRRSLGMDRPQAAPPAGAATARPDFSDVKAGSSSTAPAPAAAKPAEETYVVVAGDSLSKIARRFYGEANLWRRIYDANRATIGDNPDLIRPGQKLRIPKP